MTRHIREPARTTALRPDGSLTVKILTVETEVKSRPSRATSAEAELLELAKQADHHPSKVNLAKLSRNQLREHFAAKR